MKLRDKLSILTLLVILLFMNKCESLNSGHIDQPQNIQTITGDLDVLHHPVKREAGGDRPLTSDPVVSSVFPLNNSHLHLMVHWAGRGSKIVFCLARDQQIKETSTSHVFISHDYGTIFTDISSRFTLSNSSELATINKFFHHPHDNCYYVFTDTQHKKIFVTRDCAETVKSYDVNFSPVHIEFDSKYLSRFLVHDRESNKSELYVTDNFGETFNHAVDYIKAFFWHYEENYTELYVSRMEPSGKLNVLSSMSFFENAMDTSIVYTGAQEFEKKEDYLFIVKDDSQNEGQKRLFLAKAGDRFVEAKFSTNEELKDFHVAEVSKDGQIMIVVNHSPNKSNLYISDRISLHQAEFSLSLENIMYYAPGITWRSSWLEKIDSGDESHFADLYKVAGLKGVYIASQISPGVREEEIRPSNVTTLITFDSGAEWTRVEGPRNDTQGFPIAGCHQDQDNSCSLHIAQMMSRLYPSTRSIPVLTSSSAPGIILASANVGQTLQYKTNVFLSADAGLSWHQVLQGNYYYNIGDHGGVIVAVKYFKTEGATNVLEYSIDEGLTWNQHQFYDEKLRIFGLITEPGENTTIFTMFGSKPDSKGSVIDWIIIKVDLTDVFQRPCSQDDYKHWSPRGPGVESGGVKCVMGVREFYLRRSPRTKCYNGQDFTTSTMEEICPCYHQDFQCDFGYKRSGPKSSHDCEVEEMFQDEVGHDQVPASCPPDTFYTFSKGYIKIPGDKCEGGLEARYQPQQRACPVDLNNPRTFMLISRRKKIVKLDLSNPDAELEELPLIGISNVIAMEMDYETDCVFWADIDKDVIMKQCLRNSSVPEPLVISNLNSVEGMAYDYLSKILYFVDGNKKSIEFVKVNVNREGRMRKTILNRNVLGKPRGITVHPTEGYLFYSDWADKAACIGRSKLDGSGHKKIVTTDKNNELLLGWPNGLTIDFEVTPSRLYFVDAQKDFIASCKMDGSDFTKLISSVSETAHPFGVAIFKNLLIWNDWTRRSIYQVDKRTGSGIRIVKENVQGAMDLKIYSSRLLDKNVSGYACQKDTCSHVCVTMPMDDQEKYKCLCPDGMKVDQNDKSQCICPDGQTTQTNGTCSIGDGENCTPEQFQCSNKLCVSQMWKCDGDNDCGDNSDEVNCDLHQECSGPGMFRCDTGKCVPDHWKCDFEDDCGDNSDEKSCPRQECDPETQHKCTNGQCISLSWVCDMEQDCQDGSDEVHCPPEESQESTSCDESTHLTCDGQCLPQSWICDGDIDCPDKSDEQNCTEHEQCKDWQFQCTNGHCIFNNWECDGEHDCFDGSDEHDGCENKTSIKIPVLPQPNFPTGDCNEWMFKCASEQCIPYWWKCDGVADCDDASDEKECGHDKDHGDLDDDDDDQEPVTPAVLGCPRGKFQCNSGDCIWAAWVCDGEPDCSEAEDEDKARCDTMVTCDNKTQWQCQLSGKCIPNSKVCDNTVDCDDGTDETKCMDHLDDQDILKPEYCPNGFLCDHGHTCLDWSRKCDGHSQCIDGSDEDMCDLWAEDRLVDGLRSVIRSNTSITITWNLKDGISSSNLEYKFSQSYHTHEIWKNVTDNWVKNDKRQFTFTHLHPATQYDIRVFVRDSSSGQEAGHAPSILAVATGDGVPSCPRNIVVSQSRDRVLVSWDWPAAPNGNLTDFMVNVIRDGNIYNEIQVRVRPEMNKVKPRMNKTLYGLEIGVKYDIDVIAFNSAHHNTPCASTESVTLSDSVGPLTLRSVEDRSIKLSWKESKDPNVKYLVCHTSKNLLEGGRKCHTPQKEAAINLDGLSPSTNYNISVEVQTSSESLSHPSGLIVTTKGSPLPVPKNIKVSLHEDNPTSVKISWSVSDNVPYQFGVYYGVSVDDLYHLRPTLVNGTRTIIPGMQACTNYLFAVAVFDIGRYGVGSLSSPVLLATKYSDKSPPHHVTVVDSNTISWKSPCDPMPNKVSYHLTMTMMDIYNQTRGSPQHSSLAPVDDTTIKYIMDIPAGSMVKVTVKTDHSPPSAPVTLYGPPLPPPNQVYTHPAANQSSKFVVSWARVPGAISYDVELSPDSTFVNQTCDILFPRITSTNFMIDASDLVQQSSPECAASSQEYSVGVRSNVRNSTSELVFKSAFARAGNSIMTVNIEEPGTITIPESSAVGTVVGVLIVLLIMGSGIAYYAYTNRRMRYRFRELIASHYSSATGHATINHHGLMDDDDDDESPIIRGFNDKEPLVT